MVNATALVGKPGSSESSYRIQNSESLSVLRNAPIVRKVRLFQAYPGLGGVTLMRFRDCFASIAAALLTALLLVEAMLAGALGSESLRNPKTMIVGLLFTVGVCMWPRIHPLIYSAMLVPSFPAVYFVLAGHSRSGNLFGLVLIMFFGYGAVIGMLAAVCGYFVRRLHFAPWISVVPMGAAFVVVVVTAMVTNVNAREASSAVVDRLQEIRRAEEAYAAARPDHAYTCNGPDLGLKGIEWRANTGLTEQSQGRVKGYWIYLRCESSGHPRWFNIGATSIGASGGPRFTLDSAGNWNRDSNLNPPVR